jgi:hypothetical protein
VRLGECLGRALSGQITAAGWRIWLRDIPIWNGVRGTFWASVSQTLLQLAPRLGYVTQILGLICKMRLLRTFSRTWHLEECLPLVSMQSIRLYSREESSW